MIGIGVDLVDARRIQRSIKRFSARFLDRIFLGVEQEYVNQRLGVQNNKTPALFAKQQALHYAKMYAAKEAVLKALGTGLAQGLHWHHIEVKREATGRPYVVLHGAAQELLDRLSPLTRRIELSLSDEWPYAQAFIVII
ncbi:MAG: holo-ACP synthase [Alphaproteobacteria bacterium]